MKITQGEGMKIMSKGGTSESGDIEMGRGIEDRHVTFYECDMLVSSDYPWSITVQ